MNGEHIFKEGWAYAKEAILNNPDGSIRITYEIDFIRPFDGSKMTWIKACTRCGAIYSEYQTCDEHKFSVMMNE